MRHLRSIIILIFLILLGAVGYYVYRIQQVENQPITLYGNIDIRTTALSFRVGGRISKMDVDEGDKVKKGQPIAALDNQPYTIARSQALAKLEASQANFELLQSGYRNEQIERAKEQVKQLNSAYQYAERSFKRYTKLRANHAISQDKYDSAKDHRDRALADLKSARQQLAQYQRGNRPQQIRQAQAQVKEAQANLAKAQLDLHDTVLSAPADGTILVRSHQVGSMVSAGQSVYTLALTHPLWVKAYISETHLGLAQNGRKVTIHSDSAPQHTYHGVIGFVSPTAEFTPKTVQTEQLRTSLVYRLRIIVQDGDEKLRQGMPVTVKFAK